MGLDTIVRNAIVTINKITNPLQATVTHKAWIKADVYGTPTFAGANSYRALVEQKQELRKTASGQLVMSRATVTFVQAIPPNGASGRVEPIDPRDIITLPDGTTGPIIDTYGLIDDASTHPYMVQVWMA